MRGVQTGENVQSQELCQKSRFPGSMVDDDSDDGDLAHTNGFWMYLDEYEVV